MTDRVDKRKSRANDERKVHGQKYRKTLLDLLSKIDKDWLPPDETKLLNEKLRTFKTRHQELQIKASSLQRQIDNIHQQLTVLKDTVPDPNGQKILALIERLNNAKAVPIDPS